MTGAAIILAVGVLAAAQAAPLAFRPQVEVSGPVVTLRDVADLSRLPSVLKDRASGLEIARLAPGARRTVTAAAVVDRARVLMPALAPWLNGGADQPVMLHRAAVEPRSSAPPTNCIRALHAVTAGAIPTGEDVAPSPCTAPQPAAFRFDPAARTVRAIRDLADGDVAPAPRFALASVRPGQRLFLKTQAGPVTVDREVEAVQAARAGQSVFVRAAGGEMFAVQVAEVGR